MVAHGSVIGKGLVPPGLCDDDPQESRTAKAMQKPWGLRSADPETTLHGL